MALRDVELAIQRANTLIDDEDYYEILDSHEMNTRYMLIDPVLLALGWDLSDPEQVAFECDLNDYGRIDYVMFGKNGHTGILLESKKVDAWSLNYERQLMSYAQGTRKGYAVLTNGSLWKIWDLSKRGGFEKQLIAEFDIYEEPIKGKNGTAQLLNSTLRRNLF